MRKLAVGLMVVASICGCGLERQLVASIPVAPSFRSVAPDGYGAPTMDHAPVRTVVFKSQAERANFFAGLPSDFGGRVLDTLPSVDFSKEQALLVFFGSKPTGGYRGDIGAIEEQADKFVVHPLLWTPAPKAVVPDAEMYPYKFVAMPRSDKPVEFAPVIERTAPGPFSLF